MVHVNSEILVSISLDLIDMQTENISLRGNTLEMLNQILVNTSLELKC